MIKLPTSNSFVKFLFVFPLTFTLLSVNTSAAAEPCRLFASQKGFPGVLTDRANNMGHILSIPEYRNGAPTCVLDGPGGSLGNINTMGTYEVNSESCWLVGDGRTIPVLGGNTSGAYGRTTCKDYFAAQCTIQFSNRTSRSGIWNWDTGRCDYSSYADQPKDVTVPNGSLGLDSSVTISSYTSDYNPTNGGTGKFAGSYNFRAIWGALFTDSWSTRVYEWGTAQDVAKLGEWNGVGPTTNTVSYSGSCTSAWMSTSGPSGSISGPTSCPSYIGNDGQPHDGYVLKTSNQGCCINTEARLFLLAGMAMCKNENYLQGQVRQCVNICDGSFGISDNARPAWCQGVTKSCNCADKFKDTKGIYTVGGAQDCNNDAPASKPATCSLKTGISQTVTPPVSSVPNVNPPVVTPTSPPKIETPAVVPSFLLSPSLIGLYSRDSEAVSGGDVVSSLQKALKSIFCPSLNVTGFFGLMTLDCVKKFQTNYGLTVSGFVGQNTKAKLKELMLKLVTTTPATTTPPIKVPSPVVDSKGCKDDMSVPIDAEVNVYDSGDRFVRNPSVLNVNRFVYTKLGETHAIKLIVSGDGNPLARGGFQIDSPVGANSWEGVVSRCRGSFSEVGRTQVMVLKDYYGQGRPGPQGASLFPGWNIYPKVPAYPQSTSVLYPKGTRTPDGWLSDGVYYINVRPYFRSGTDGDIILQVRGGSSSDYTE